VVFRTCQELLVQKKTLGSLGQASVEYVHVNNPIPEVSGNRISRFDFTATVNPILKPTLDPKSMEQIKPNYFGGGNFEARTVKDIIEPAKSISNKVSVRAALDQMQAQATDSSPVVDQCGELLGILSKNKMNRNVGGFGHDPKTEPLEAHIEKNNAYCFEDQTIAEAEQMMLNAKLGEVFVVTREKLLVGTINIEAIAQEGKKLGSRLNSESVRGQSI
jgi:signal-transduction protein with cAMP-binding, CBS, and nucleotidyltransferase domain